MSSEARADSRGERLADYLVHLIGVPGAAVACVVLLVLAGRHANGATMASLSIYCLGLMAMLGCSAWYNIRHHSQRVDLYRRLDHAAIFVMIAGTYTPILVAKIDGLAGTVWLAVVWAIAAFGVLICLFGNVRREAILVAAYLGMGWNVLLWIDRLLAAVPLPFVALIGAGGLLYSLGVVFHLLRWLPYQNAIWHGFVLTAAGCHYAAMIGMFVLPGDFLG